MQVLLSHPPDSYGGDALSNFQLLAQLPCSCCVWPEVPDRPPDLIVDALLGTGVQAALRSPIAEMIPYFQSSTCPVVAIDLPSGLDASSGRVCDIPLRASQTFSFQLSKVCHYVWPAAGYCGEVEVLDIGIWPEVISGLGISREGVDAQWLRSHYLPRDPDGHKGKYGHVLLVGGSSSMPGAMALACMGALYGGAGLLTTFTPEAARYSIQAHVPEAMCVASFGEVLCEDDEPRFKELLSGKSVVVMGPGMGTSPESLAFMQKALPHINVPLLLDADALNALAIEKGLWEHLPAETLLTPHPGEMARLCGRSDVQSQRLEAVEAFAQEKKFTIVLKGAGSITALPDGKSYINTSGNPGMATGGTGDVLAGLIAALWAQGYGTDAAPLGAFLHGVAGDIVAAEAGQEGLSASALARCLPRAWQKSLFV